MRISFCVTILDSASVALLMVIHKKETTFHELDDHTEAQSLLKLPAFQNVKFCRVFPEVLHGTGGPSTTLEEILINQRTWLNLGIWFRDTIKPHCLIAISTPRLTLEFLLGS